MNKRISIEEVREIHENKFKGHWFDKDSQRFFNSRWSSYALQHQDIAFFVSSEQFDNKSPRLYTVRAVNMKSGDFLCVDNFQSFETSSQAWISLKQLFKLYENNDKDKIRKQIQYIFYTNHGGLSSYRPNEEWLITCEVV